MHDAVKMLTLANEALTVRVLPELGGKICGLKDEKTGFECLFQNPKVTYARPQCYDSFANYDASGFDDAFPNIDESWSLLNGRRIHFPDHGEIWSMPMTAQMDGDAILLRGEGRVLPYRYAKRISLQGRQMHLHYTIENSGTEPLPFFWTMHCLVNVDAKTRLILPEEPMKAENVLAGTDLGEVGSLLDVRDGKLDLMHMPEVGAASMRKYYLAGAVKTGACGFLFPPQRLCMMITYDAKILPYLGMWCTMGGFRGDVNAALEPSSAYYDSVDTAMARGTLTMLAQGETKCFTLCFSLEDVEEGEGR